MAGHQCCRSIGVQLRPLRRAQLTTAGLSSLVTGMAVHPHAKLHTARKLVAMLPVHRGVAVVAAAATISTDLLPTQPSLTPRGVCPDHLFPINSGRMPSSLTGT